MKQIIFGLSFVSILSVSSTSLALPLYQLLPQHRTISGENMDPASGQVIDYETSTITSAKPPQITNMPEVSFEEDTYEQPIPRTNDYSKYEKYYEKGIRRVEILEIRNNKLETSVDLYDTIGCIENSNIAYFQSLGKTPKEAFSFWMDSCGFDEMLTEVKKRETNNSNVVSQISEVDEIDEPNYDSESLINKINYHIGVHISEDIINAFLNPQYRDEATNTILGNTHGITHSIADQNFSELENIGIHELLGVGISNYSGSNWNRKVNVRNAAYKLDGKIVHSGESISVGATLSPFTYNNGYTEGIIIKEGENEKEMGGGVCQSVTTIFRAWQNSGLEVSRFKPHSKSIGYYGHIGLDATIYYPQVDLVLKNNTPNSILIKVVDREPYQLVFLYGTKDRNVILERTGFSRWSGGQEANWTRQVEYNNSGEWVQNWFDERQGR